jgi:hypothetical protein
MVFLVLNEIILLEEESDSVPSYAIIDSFRLYLYEKDEAQPEAKYHNVSYLDLHFEFHNSLSIPFDKLT